MYFLLSLFYFVLPIFSQTILSATGNVGLTLSPNDQNANWQTRNNIRALDGSFTSATLTNSTRTSSLLYANRFSLTVPTTAIIAGIKVTILRRSSVAPLSDIVVAITLNDGIIGTGQNISWNVGALRNDTFGNTFDTWGASLTPSIVNDNAFGFVIQISCGNNCLTTNADIDYLELTAYYYFPLTSGSLATNRITTSLLTSGQLTTSQLTMSQMSTGNEFSSEQISSSPNNQNKYIYIGVGAGAGGIIITTGIIFGIFFIRNKKRKPIELGDIELEAQKRRTKELRNSITVTDGSEYAPMPSGRSSPSGTIKRISDRFVDPDLPKWVIRYEDLVLSDSIGEGSFGVVYKGLWRNAPVAVKQMKNITGKHKAAFVDEVNLQASLRSHPNVLQFHGACIDPSHPFCLVTEYMPMGNLKTFLSSNGNVEIEKKIFWIKGIAAGFFIYLFINPKGMLHISQEGIVHRDLAARNILLSGDLTPKISDFGLSRFTGNEKESYQTISDVGPLKWMSPESLLRKEYSTLSDSWSFGVVIFEIVTQLSPYPDLDPAQASAQLIAREVSLKLPKGTSPILVKVFEGCMKWDPKQRYNFEKICKIFAEN